MHLQAAGLVRFIALHIPTGKMSFEFLGEHVEHENGIAVGIFHLFGGFAVDGGNERGVLENSVNKLGEGILQVGKREFFQNTNEGCDAWYALFSNAKVLSESFAMDVCPALDGGGGGALGEESEKDEGEDNGKGVGLSAFGAGNRHFLRHCWERVSGKEGVMDNFVGKK